MTSWTRQDEKALNYYIQQNLKQNGQINWDYVLTYLPDRTITQCKCKFYRMLGQPGWDFAVSRKRHLSSADIDVLTELLAQQ